MEEIELQLKRDGERKRKRKRVEEMQVPLALKSRGEESPDLHFISNKRERCPAKPPKKHKQYSIALTLDYSFFLEATSAPTADLILYSLSFYQ